MIVTNEKCHICGEIVDFVIDDNAVLLREAKCSNCKASIRNSDVAGEILGYINESNGDLISMTEHLSRLNILNACSSGYIHNVLKNLPNYTCCEYLDGISSGEYDDGVLCVDLCNIPFLANTFDLVITEDVFEHIVHYEKAMEEIQRVLKVGGCHIFTVPIHENKKTESRDGKQPVYHDDPVRPQNGTLVVTDWGEDVKDIIEKYGYRVEVKKIHSFYTKEEVSDVDSDYEGYLRNAKHLDRYLKYNSVVIIAEKVTETLSVKDDCIQPKSAEIVALNRAIRNKNDEIRALNDDNEMRGKHIVELDQELQNAGERITTLQEADEEKNRHILKLDGHIDELGNRISELDQQNNELNQHNKELDEQNKELGQHNKELGQRNEELNQQNSELNQQNSKLGQQNKELKQHAVNQAQKIENLKDQIADLQQIVLNKEGHIELLLEVERKFEHEKTTHAYRLAKKLQRIGNKLLPLNSRRRFFARIIFNMFRHPRLMLHVVNPKRIRNYLKYMRLEGMEGVKKRYEEAVDIERMQLDPSSRLNLELEQTRVGNSMDDKTVADYDSIEFPVYVHPAVSVIIPVYNEFAYTYNCLKSILRNTGDIAYEVLIADDCSTDVTKEVEKIAKNVQLITTKENVGFLRNCNHAARYAKGKYILFLNNDTQVQANWLEPLVNLIERDEEIGMVGSKLVYPDGYLQEAGGIVWNDASAWNYGNRKSPEDPEYNYVKEADYISGAAIMIRKSLWEEIGGFDERFAPAYCEDSDLAFEVRRHGYKVMYQPLSVVVHFEGVSNGTDIDSGLKSFQVVNQQKFRDKWQDVLTGHFANAEKVFIARDRSYTKRVLLVVDHYVPHYDKDAGSRTVFQYLRMFVNKGYHVIFIGDNFYRHEPYTTTLQQMGIEVLYGPYYANHWKEWIKENAEFIEYVFLNRPHISFKYIDFIRNNTNARIIYYGHDLHFLREMRKYEVTKDEKALTDSEDWKKKELALMKKADVVYYPSNVEVCEIAKIDSTIKAKAITAYIFEDVATEEYRFDLRKDIMFVGGFTHTPNTDAVLWFAKKILPAVLEQIPELRFYIMGSNAPLEIQNLANDHVIVKGFVADDELVQFYHNCRISVVPLRYGAGIKGKVIEAMRYGMPVVTTSVGAEGIEGAEQILCIEDEEQAIISKLITLYNDGAELTRMSKQSFEYIRGNFSEEGAWRVVEKDFC